MSKEMAQPKPRRADGDDDPATGAAPGELEFAAVKIELSSYPRVMGMLVGLAASASDRGTDDLFGRVRARPQPDGDLLIAAPMPDGTQREIRVPAADWRLLTPEERQQPRAPLPSAFDLRDRPRRG